MLFFVVQTPAPAKFLFPFPWGISKNFFSKSCSFYQCSHLYVNIFFVSLITKKWIFAKIGHSKSSVLLLGIVTYFPMYYVINELTSTLSRLFWVEVKEWRWGDSGHIYLLILFSSSSEGYKMSLLKPNPTRRSNHLAQSKKSTLFWVIWL